MSASNGASTGNKNVRLLALIATKDMDIDEAALKLDGIGFNAGETFALHEVDANYVSVVGHRKRAGGKRKIRKKVGRPLIPKINQDLLDRLAGRLGGSEARVYALIQTISAKNSVPRFVSSRGR